MNQALNYLLPGSTLQEVGSHWSGYYAVKGRYRGYWFVLETNRNAKGPANGVSLITVNLSFADQEQAQMVVNRVGQELGELQLPGVRRNVLEVSAFGHTLRLVVPALLNRKKIERHINPVMQRMFAVLEQAQMSSGCAICGNPTELSAYFVNGTSHFLCDQCAAELEQKLAEHQADVRSRRGSVFTGVVGALLGGLIGVALWFAVYQIGYLAAICGLVMAVCALKGYELFGKHLDRRGVIICCVILAVFTLLSVRLCWAYMIFDALQSAGYTDTFGDCFGELESYLEALGSMSSSSADLMGEYSGEVAMGFFFTALGAFGAIRQSYHSAGGDYQFKKQ